MAGPNSMQRAEEEALSGLPRGKAYRAKKLYPRQRDPLECPITQRRRMLMEKRKEKEGPRTGEDVQGLAGHSPGSAPDAGKGGKKGGGGALGVRACIAAQNSKRSSARKDKSSAKGSESAWQIPPCISNWKNPKGLVAPLDQRVQKKRRFE